MSIGNLKAKVLNELKSLAMEVVTTKFMGGESVDVERYMNNIRNHVMEAVQEVNPELQAQMEEFAANFQKAADSMGEINPEEVRDLVTKLFGSPSSKSSPPVKSCPKCELPLPDAFYEGHVQKCNNTPEDFWKSETDDPEAEEAETDEK